MMDMEELVFAFPTDELWKLITYKEKGLIKGNSEALKQIVHLIHMSIKCLTRKRLQGKVTYNLITSKG